MRGDATVLVGVSTDDLHDEALQGVKHDNRKHYINKLMRTRKTA
jgi:hypothetical protein